jgi:hypothetical protein
LAAGSARLRRPGFGTNASRILDGPIWLCGFALFDAKLSSYLENNVDIPMAPVFYTISIMHGMTHSLAEGGAGLGRMWGQEKAREMLADAGFNNVQMSDTVVPADGVYVCTKKASF